MIQGVFGDEPGGDINTTAVIQTPRNIDGAIVGVNDTLFNR